MLTYTKEKVGVANGATNTAKKAKENQKVNKGDAYGEDATDARQLAILSRE